jgi:hypothetical protein
VRTLSNKEQKIQDLERALSEQRKVSGQDVDEIKKKLNLLFGEYREALKNFGVCPGPLPENEEISDLMDCIEAEFWALPDVILGATESLVWGVQRSPQKLWCSSWPTS